MSDWVTTILSAISSLFTSLYTVYNSAGEGTANLASNPILACILLPVVGGVAAFCVRLAKRARK